MFLHVESIQTLTMDSPYFIKMSFFTQCAPFLFQIQENFNIHD